MGLESWVLILPASSAAAATAGAASASLCVATSDHHLQQHKVNSSKEFGPRRRRYPLLGMGMHKRWCRASSSLFDSGSSSYKQKRDINSNKVPTSLRNLRRQRVVSHPAPEEEESSIKKAFSSMVYMLKSMQRYTLEVLVCDQGKFNLHLQEVWCLVQKEMHASFLWLFQQVFACTPRLMLSVMILLVNFTAYSMDFTLLGLAVQFPPPQVASGTTTSAAAAAAAPSDQNLDSIAAASSSSGAGHGGKNRNVHVAAGMDGEGLGNWAWNRKKKTTMLNDKGNKKNNNEDVTAISRYLDPGIKESLVAPVSAKLEPDDYECFDRTDLLYQQALSQDGGNPLILANYAQFLYLVRHDHDRAEKLFRLAKEADPSDGEAVRRLASFLWLARGDTQAAEAAFREAIASDPTNPFYVGNYAHFLWHSGEANSEDNHGMD